MRQAGFTIVALALGASALAAAAERKATTADYTFRYVYPDVAARHPALRRWLEADAAKVRAEIARDAAAGRRDARGSGYPFNRYEAQTIWRTVTDTPRFLSLSGDVYTFTGGAHGSPGSAALLWDKVAQRRVAPVAVFRSPAALTAAIGRPFCARLDAERLRRRGEPTPRGNTFGNCPKLDELTVLLGSSKRQRIDRIGLIADPYVAGPYAESNYEITLPVTPAVVAAVKPAYRSAF